MGTNHNKKKKNTNTRQWPSAPWFFAGFLEDEILPSQKKERLEWRIIRIPTWMSQKVSKWLVSGLFHLLLDGVYWGYNPLILTIY